MSGQLTAKERFIPGKEFKEGRRYRVAVSQNGITKNYVMVAKQTGVLPYFVPSFFESLTPVDWYGFADDVDNIMLMPGDRLINAVTGERHINDTGEANYREGINFTNATDIDTIAGIVIVETGKINNINITPLYQPDIPESVRSFPRHHRVFNMYPVNIPTQVIYRITVMEVFVPLLSNIQNYHTIEIWNTSYGIPTVSGALTKTYVAASGSERWQIQIPNTLSSYLLTVTNTGGTLNLHVDAE
jgi:hypothetical protein